MSAWFDDLGDRLRVTASAITRRVDELDDRLDALARRALGEEDGADASMDGAERFQPDENDDARGERGDGDLGSGYERREFDDADVEALRRALGVAREEIRAREEEAREARSEAASARDAATRAAMEMVKMRAKVKDGDADAGAGGGGDAAANGVREDADAAREEARRAREETAELERSLRSARESEAALISERDAAREAARAAEERLRGELDEARKKIVELEQSRAAEVEDERVESSRSTSGGRGGKKKGKKGGGGGATPTPSADDARAQQALKDLAQVTADRDELRKAVKELEAKLEASAKDRVEELERVRAEIVIARESSAEDVMKLETAEARAVAAEARVTELEEQTAASSSSQDALRAELTQVQERARLAESQIAALRDELTDAVAAREDAEAAVSRGAVNAAGANAKMAAAEKARAKAEAELAEVRKQLELMDATGREAASSIAAREKAELAQQRAEARLTVAEKEADEARTRCEKITLESEERKRRFAHVQSQFQVTEKELREKLDTCESELKSLRAHAQEAEKMKAEAISIVEEAQAETSETRAALEQQTARIKMLESELEVIQIEASEARTKLGVVEEMLALRSAPPVPEPPREVPKRSMSTQTEREETKVLVSTSDEFTTRERLSAIMTSLNIAPAKRTGEASREHKDSVFGMGVITGLFSMGSDETDTKPTQGAGGDEESVQALLDRIEAWASERPRETLPPTSREINGTRDEEIRALKAELAALKADEGERSTASLVAVNRRAQEAERAAAEAKAKLAPLERENRELAWQISMLAEQDDTKIRPVLAQSGWLARAVTGCTAPRRRSVLLGNPRDGGS